jgi:hypothetical protein
MPTLTREQLYERLWAEPATKLAATLGLSSVALGKIAKTLGVPAPPRAYASRCHASPSGPPTAPRWGRCTLGREMISTIDGHGSSPRTSATLRYLSDPGSQTWRSTRAMPKPAPDRRTPCLTGLVRRKTRTTGRTFLAGFRAAGLVTRPRPGACSRTSHTVCT